MTQQLPYLNLGCGRVIMPTKPKHYGLVETSLLEYPTWWNVDRNPEPGVDQTLDIFAYPWPWDDNSFGGALCAHVVEHIPHDIRRSKITQAQADKMEAYRRSQDVLLPGTQRDDPLRAHETYGWDYSAPRADELAGLQDGWYAFFAELHRVLVPDALIHVLSPYAWSAGAVTDPTHTRLITEHTFSHSMQPDPDSPFKYATGGLNLELQGFKFGLTPFFAHLADSQERMQYALQTQINVAYEIYAILKVIKEGDGDGSATAPAD